MPGARFLASQSRSSRSFSAHTALRPPPKDFIKFNFTIKNCIINDLVSSSSGRLLKQFALRHESGLSR